MESECMHAIQYGTAKLETIRLGCAYIASITPMNLRARLHQHLQYE